MNWLILTCCLSLLPPPIDSMTAKKTGNEKSRLEKKEQRERQETERLNNGFDDVFLHCIALHGRRLAHRGAARGGRARDKKEGAWVGGGGDGDNANCFPDLARDVDSRAVCPWRTRR